MHFLEYKKEIYKSSYISRTLIELVGSYSESGEWLRKKAQWSGMGRCGQANMAYTDAEDKETIKSWLD